MPSRSGKSLGRITRRVTRDGLIFCLGLAGMFNEFFIREGPERPYVIGASMVMLGLPAFIKWDQSGGPPPPSSGGDGGS